MENNLEEISCEYSGKVVAKIIGEGRRRTSSSSSSSICTKETIVNLNPRQKGPEDMLLCCCMKVQISDQLLNNNNRKLEWIVGNWRSEFSGKVFWPTVPTMTFGEELNIDEAPIAKSINVQFLNFSARAWSHTTKDHFHDEWGYLTVDSNGNATLMTAGNNGERSAVLEKLFRSFPSDRKSIFNVVSPRMKLEK
ncbi:hypothetical protein TELCIR_05090 [Teladorsagia circumcincta]|uniref:THAP4-like heme-binding domain-containing protein n=1 Tax=Teladorsagia circumcincta TaxID=45464 RepID=A0A2G9US40_TELCI|nr:hypothetical protein TELCIR_05090 [Teladorsagia circumcincta]